MYKNVKVKLFQGKPLTPTDGTGRAPLILKVSSNNNNNNNNNNTFRPSSFLGLFFDCSRIDSGSLLSIRYTYLIHVFYCHLKLPIFKYLNISPDLQPVHHSTGYCSQIQIFYPKIGNSYLFLGLGARWK